MIAADYIELEIAESFGAGRFGFLQHAGVKREIAAIALDQIAQLKQERRIVAFAGRG